jgi:transcriptional regulator with XRE-family HTH domain
MTIAISPAMAEARRLRESKGVTQAELSRRAGYALMSVHRWDSGRAHPSVHAFSTYLEALGLRIKIEPISSVAKDSAA